MAGISNYTRDKVLNFLRGTAMGAAPTSRIGLWSGNPTGSGTGGTEVSATISARQSISFSAASSKQMTNSAIVNWGASAGSATVDYWAIRDALTAGNTLWYGPFAQAKAIAPGDTVEINTGGIQLSSSGSMTNGFMEAVMDWIRGQAFPYTAGTVFVALYNGNPKVAGTEVTTTIRPGGRLAVTFGTPSGGTISNSAEVNFGNAAGAATVTHAAIFSASSGGSMYLAEALQSTISPAINDIVKFAVGAIQFNIS